MAPHNGSTQNQPPPLLALVLRPPPLADVLVSGIQEFHNRLKATISQVVTSLPPQLRALLQLHSNAHQVARSARISTPLRGHNFAAVIPGDSLAELVVTRGLSNFFSLYNTLLLVRIICTWFPDAPRAIVNPISTICDPYLNLFRGLIPPLGGTLDFSPILAFLLLDAFSNAATALPAELPQEPQRKRGNASRRRSSPL